MPRRRYEPAVPDADAAYHGRSRSTDAALSPQIACPHAVDNVRPIEEVAGKHVHQVFIGSCANAKYEDLAEAAVHPARPRMSRQASG